MARYAATAMCSHFFRGSFLELVHAAASCIVHSRMRPLCFKRITMLSNPLSPPGSNGGTRPAI
jgi:hypothetical protein